MVLQCSKGRPPRAIHQCATALAPLTPDVQRDTATFPMDQNCNRSYNSSSQMVKASSRKATASAKHGVRQNPLTTCERCGAEMKPKRASSCHDLKPSHMHCAALKADASPQAGCRNIKGLERDMNMIKLLLYQQLKGSGLCFEVERPAEGQTEGFAVRGLGEDDHFGLTQKGTTLVPF